MKILFRKDKENEEEYKICKEVFGSSLIESRMDIGENELVVGRYSVLPFYTELYRDCKKRNSNLIHTPQQHNFLADLKEWYPHFEGYTPRSWWDCGYASVPDTEHGYIIKGATNSRKHQWKNRTYAPDKETLQHHIRLFYEDQMLSEQGLIIREFVKLKTFGWGINDLPITNEWRFFILDNEILSYGYYWSWWEDPPTECPEGVEFVNFILEKNLFPENGPRFVVMDVGELEKGGWTIIEFNEGQMSGPSLVNVEELYRKLKSCLT